MECLVPREPATVYLTAAPAVLKLMHIHKCKHAFKFNYTEKHVFFSAVLWSTCLLWNKVCCYKYLSCFVRRPFFLFLHSFLLAYETLILIASIFSHPPTTRGSQLCRLPGKVLGMKKSNMIKTMIAASNSFSTHTLY